MNIANSRYHKVRKIEKSEQNKVGKNEKIGIIRLEKLNIMYIGHERKLGGASLCLVTIYEIAGGNHD